MQNQKSVWGLSQQVMSLALASNCLWRTLGIGVGVIGIGAIAQIAPAQAAVLTQWQFNSAANQLEITVPEGTQPRYFLLAKPARIVLDLPNTQMGQVPAEQTLSGPVQQIRVSQQQTGFTRIVMQLAPNVVFAPGQVKLEQVSNGKTGTRWVLRPLIANPGNSASTPAVAAKPAAPSTATASPQSAPPTPPALKPAQPPASSAQPQPTPPAVTSERSQPAPSASPPKNRITRNAADLVAPGDRPSADLFASPATPSPEQPTTEAAQPTTAATDAAIFTPRLSPTVPATTPTPASPPPQSTPVRDRPVATTPVKPTTPAKPSTPPKPPAPSTAARPPVKPAAQPPATPPKPEVAIAPTPAAAPTVSQPVSEPQPPAAPVVAEPVETAPVAPVQPEVKPTPNPPQPTTELETAVLPPANFRSQQPVTVAVPSINAAPSQVRGSGDRALPATTTNAESDSVLPPADFTPQPSATVTVPPLSSATVEAAPTRAVASEPPGASRTTDGDEAVERVIEFGQPLTATNSAPSAATPPNLPALEPETELPTETSSAVSTRTAPVTVPPLPRSTTSNSATELDFQRPPEAAPTQPNLAPESSSLIAVGNGIVLPSGTTLQLQYSGTETLELKPGNPQQEVLLLQTEIRDRNGSILAPTGAPVIGRFETTSGGSRFVAQAISLQGRNVPLAAESALLGGKSQVSQNKVVRNSALGALAGALVGGLSGEEVIGGAAAGAAVTYLASPKPAKLQPGQVLQIRLTEALRSP